MMKQKNRKKEQSTIKRKLDLELSHAVSVLYSQPYIPLILSATHTTVRKAGKEETLIHFDSVDHTLGFDDLRVSLTAGH